jgi:hypothetical protein
MRALAPLHHFRADAPIAIAAPSGAAGGDARPANGE